MQTHMDSDSSQQPKRNQISELFMSELERRAAEITRLEKSRITAGDDGEPVLARWEAKGFGVLQRPNDPQGILRISVGGGEGLPVSLNYLVFRGDHGQCVDLLRKALKALESGPK